jgi:hypothetical protein
MNILRFKKFYEEPTFGIGKDYESTRDRWYHVKLKEHVLIERSLGIIYGDYLGI